MMTSGRPAIPAELHRRILVEAGHRCAIPTCRYIEVEVCHIIPWGKCQKHEYENLIALCPNCHQRADKGEIDRKSLRMYKANLRYTHDKFSQFEVDLLFEAYKLTTPAIVILLPTWAMLLAKRLIDAGYIEWRVREAKVKAGGFKLNADHVVITDKGRQFIDSLGFEHKDWY